MNILSEKSAYDLFYRNICRLIDVFGNKNLNYTGFLLIFLVFIFTYINQALLQTIGFDFKLYAIILGIGLFISGIYSLKFGKILWSDFKTYRLISLFFIVNILYFLFYHSDFMLSKIKAGYLVSFSSDFSNYSAYFIDFLNSLCAFIGLTCGLIIFLKINNKKELKEMFFWVLKVISYCISGIIIFSFLFSFLGVLKYDFSGTRLTGGLFSAAGMHIILSVTVLFLISLKYFAAFKFNISAKKNKLLNNSINFNILISLILIVFYLNKSSIIALGLSLFIWIFLALKYGLLKSTKKVGHKNSFLFYKIFVSFILFALIIFSINSDFLAVVFHNVIDRFSSISTLNARMINWQNFVEEWYYGLNPITFLFGFGAGASRESIFFISAMQPNNLLVQTVHNIYMEMLYDYGFLSCLYFGALFLILKKNISLFQKSADAGIKHIGLGVAAIIVFFIIYHLTDGVRVTTQLVLFSAVGFMESLNFILSKLNTANNNEEI